MIDCSNMGCSERKQVTKTISEVRNEAKIDKKCDESWKEILEYSND
jgi:hypothetical protein